MPQSFRNAANVHTDLMCVLVRPMYGLNDALDSGGAWRPCLTGGGVTIVKAVEGLDLVIDGPVAHSMLPLGYLQEMHKEAP